MVCDFVWTDGIEFLAENAEAFWLIDLIASYQTDPKVCCEPFQVWTLELRPEGGAIVYVQRDSGEPHIVEQKLDFTDFPEHLGPKFELWAEQGSIDARNTVTVLMLPSER
jgi:hypothetical protein